MLTIYLERIVSDILTTAHRISKADEVAGNA
jgi:hypothetical protein